MSKNNSFGLLVLICMLAATLLSFGCRLRTEFCLTLTQEGVVWRRRLLEEVELRKLLREKRVSLGMATVKVLCGSDVKLGELEGLIEEFQIAGFPYFILASISNRTEQISPPIEIVNIDYFDGTRPWFPSDVQLYFHFSGENYYVNGHHFSRKNEAIKVAGIVSITNTLITCSMQDRAGQLLSVLNALSKDTYSGTTFLGFTRFEDVKVLSAINDAIEKREGKKEE